jgi:hypothetical protein
MQMNKESPELTSHEKFIITSKAKEDIKKLSFIQKWLTFLLFVIFLGGVSVFMLKACGIITISKSFLVWFFVVPVFISIAEANLELSVILFKTIHKYDIQIKLNENEMNKVKKRQTIYFVLAIIYSGLLIVVMR